MVRLQDLLELISTIDYEMLDEAVGEYERSVRRQACTPAVRQV